MSSTNPGHAAIIQWRCLQDSQLNQGMCRIQTASGISHRAQHSSPVMLLLVLFTEIFPLGQVCFAMFMPRKDQIPLFSAREELITGWPFHQTQFFPHWLCCPCHLCMSSLTSLISTVWRSWHPPPGEWGHAFVTHSCAAALFNGFNYIIFWVCFASVPRQKLLGDASLHSALVLSRQSTDHHQL